MKKVFTNSEIAHPWAHQTQSEGNTSTGSIFFRDTIIFSYGEHFPMAKIHTGPDGEWVYFVTNRKYSVTTSGHLSRVRRAIPGNAKIFFVYDPTLSPVEQIKSFETDIKQAEESVLEAKNKVSRAKRYGILEAEVNDASEFAKYFRLPNRFELRSDFEALKAEYEERQRKENIARAKIATRLQRESKKREAKQLIDNAGLIEKWKRGKFTYLPYLSKTFLRVKGDVVETSRCVDFPVTHAVAALKLIERVRTTKQPYKRNGHTLHLGHYAVDSIDENGNVTAGCHYVEYDEIARIAPEVLASVQEEVTV